MLWLPPSGSSGQGELSPQFPRDSAAYGLRAEPQNGSFAPSRQLDRWPTSRAAATRIRAVSGWDNQTTAPDETQSRRSVIGELLLCARASGDAGRAPFRNERRPEASMGGCRFGTWSRLGGSAASHGQVPARVSNRSCGGGLNRRHTASAWCASSTPSSAASDACCSSFAQVWRRGGLMLPLPGEQSRSPARSPM
jgi:hypothetical protein